MLLRSENIISIILSIFITTNCFGQAILKEFTVNNLSDREYSILKSKIGNHKIIPAQYEKPILLALCYFPELIDIDIEFRIKHVIVPLASRPAWSSIFINKSDRRYVITISDRSINALSPILFKALDFNAQVGVIGHEISHVVDFNNRNSFGLLSIGFGNLSKKYLDRFEYSTDSICIAHGLGYQLLAWSIFVRKALMHENWDGADNINTMMQRERYMNPGTIRSRIKSMALYHNQ